MKKALDAGGPTLLHTIDPRPKGWDYHPRYSNLLWELAVKTGIFADYEIIKGKVKYTYDLRKRERLPVKQYLEKQGRFSHFTEEDYDYVQSMVDEMWEDWELPCILPIRGGLAVEK